MQTENMHQLIQLNRTVRTRNTTVSKSLLKESLSIWAFFSAMASELEDFSRIHNG